MTLRTQKTYGSLIPPADLMAYVLSRPLVGSARAHTEETVPSSRRHHQEPREPRVIDALRPPPVRDRLESASCPPDRGSSSKGQLIECLPRAIFRGRIDPT